MKLKGEGKYKTPGPIGAYLSGKGGVISSGPQRLGGTRWQGEEHKDAYRRETYKGSGHATLPKRKKKAVRKKSWGASRG